LLIESFIIEKETSHKDIIKCYASDYDGDKWPLLGNIFLDEAKPRKSPFKNVDNVLKLMENNDALCQILLESNKILCIMLLIPVSSCTLERSFSALDRIKVYIKYTMNQTWLIDISIVYVHRDEEINLEIVANQFIIISKVRKNKFLILVL
jgi:hypothetical protein